MLGARPTGSFSARRAGLAAPGINQHLHNQTHSPPCPTRPIRTRINAQVGAHEADRSQADRGGAPDAIGAHAADRPATLG